jgi:hypothetical protein
MYTLCSLHVLHGEGPFVGTVSCSARWTGWLVQVSEAECLRGLGVVVMMMNVVWRRQAVAVPQYDRRWAHRRGSAAADGVRASRGRWLLTALLSIQVPSPFGSRVLKPNLHERRKSVLQRYRVRWTKVNKLNAQWGSLVSCFRATDGSATRLLNFLKPSGNFTYHQV